MAEEQKTKLRLEIAHVLFIDIVAYSKLSIDEQRRAIERLNEVVQQTEEFQNAESAKRLVKIPTGDGMALVFYDSPESPVECAMEISRKLSAPDGPRVRMGIHSGPVSGVVDLNGRGNVAGEGINTAQRVMSCGDAGHILLSKRLANDLAQFKHWRPHLHDIGETEVKHGARVGLVNLFTSDIGNSDRPSKLEYAPAAAAHTGQEIPSERKRLPWFWLAAGALVLFALSGVVLFLRGRTTVRPASSTENIAEKSIAVLPFENLSRDPDNAYFADGIQDEILTRLSKIADLKVISRTSTQRYKSAPENLSQIAKELGVAHILEGTVQKATDQVRVNVQLINALNDSHLWAEKYDRKLTDIFAVESEIATRIAETLQARLTGSEQKAIASRPTENSEAHQLYLRGRYLSGKRDAKDLNSAIDYYKQAIDKDPNYALAYAGIADAYAVLPDWSGESAADCFPKSRAAATKALAIDGNLPEAHVSLALVLYNDIDLRGSERELERAIELNPNYADAHYFLGNIVLAPLGKFEPAIAELKRAIELDPFSSIINSNLGYCYYLARRYPEAIAQLQKAAELDANFMYPRVQLAEAYQWNGNIAEAKAEFEKIYSLGHSYKALARLANLYGTTGEREKALELLRQVEERGQTETQWAYFYAIIYLGLGEKGEAIDFLERSYSNKESGVINYIKVDPALDPLQGDPRFEALVQKVTAPKASDHR